MREILNNLLNRSIYINIIYIIYMQVITFISLFIRQIHNNHTKQTLKIIKTFYK